MLVLLQVSFLDPAGKPGEFMLGGEIEQALHYASRFIEQGRTPLEAHIFEGRTRVQLPVEWFADNPFEELRQQWQAILSSTHG